MHYRKSLTVSNIGVLVTRLIILIVLILKIEFSVCDVLTNSSNDKSICRRHHRITSKLVSYVETYEDSMQYQIDIRTRINWRFEPVDEWESIDTCCDGYEPQTLNESKSMHCVPVCASNCVNGTCLGPNLCTCNAGYREEISKVTGYSNCVPDCPSGCLRGICSAPNTCYCYDGYFFAEDKGGCEAMCTAVGGVGPRGCVDNARCVQPNRCQCNDGYIATANSSSLVNQSLISDETTAGKSLDIAVQLTFNTSSVICKALCDPKCSVNSSCVAPNTCQCNSGFRSASPVEKEINNSQCIPICKRSCVNGFCESPDKCTCHEGYKAHLNFSDFCEPICENKCINANCVRPNTCACKDGYEKLIIQTRQREGTSDNKCVPICPGKCPNGNCFAPGECHCNAGYVLEFLQSNETIIAVENTTTSNGSLLNHLSRQSCRPVCEPECPMGSQCIAPHQCHSENNWILPGAIVATILLLALLILVVIYLARRKIIKIGILDGISRDNARTMQQLETMESPLHRSDDRSHL